MFYQKGNIRLEKILAITIFVGLSTVFTYKIIRLTEASEKIIIESRVKQLQAALNLHFAELMMLGKQQDAVMLKDSNPVLLFNKLYPRQQLDGYLGERWSVSFEQLAAGSWIFDTKHNTLIYKLKNGYLVNNSDPLPLRLQWRVRPQLIQENDLIRKQQKTRVESIQLVQVYVFNWN